MTAISLNNEERKWLQREYDTWRLIRACFAEYVRGKTPTADKLHALCMLTWITTGADNTGKVTLPALRTLTGKEIPDCHIVNLSDKLADAGITSSIVSATKNPTGFVNFYNAFRYSSRDWFAHRAKAVYALLEKAFVLSRDEQAKAIYDVIANLDGVDRGGGGGEMSPKNLLTPVIACLDPRKRCPVINGRNAVRQKLKAIGVEKQDLAAQFVALINLVHQGGITDAFMLDVVSVEHLRTFSHAVQRRRSRFKRSAKEKPLLEKNENEIEVLTKASLTSYIRIHNSMTNRLRSYCESSGRVVCDSSDRECCFDALVKNYDGEYRDLLIEAKSFTDTAFCRMAVGQLLDYRRQLRGSATTDLAVLFNGTPEQHVLDFLGHVGVKALWFMDDRIVDASGSTLFP